MWKADAFTKKNRIGLVLKKLRRNQWWASLSMMVKLPCFVLYSPLEILNTTVIDQGIVQKQQVPR